MTAPPDATDGSDNGGTEELGSGNGGTEERGSGNGGTEERSTGNGGTEDDTSAAALALAYRYVDRRERTVSELSAHLAGRGVEPAVVQKTVAQLCDHGYVDDARFARLFAADKRDLEGWGSERIARALRERGLASELIDAALEPSSRGDELERALALLRRRWPAPSHERRERDRALGMLLRKGYDDELAIEALNLHARGQ
jgi:regulatory protein